MHMNWVRDNRPHARRPLQRDMRRWRWWLPAAALTACLIAASATSSIGAAASAHAAFTPLNCAPPGTKMTPVLQPRAYQVAYGVAPLLNRGIDGSGETVVMPELVSSPGPATDIRKDLATFDNRFGLPAPSCTS